MFCPDECLDSLRRSEFSGWPAAAHHNHHRVGLGALCAIQLLCKGPQVSGEISVSKGFLHRADRVGLTTDCGMKQLPRTVARAKLASLTAGAEIVRRELTG